MILAYSSDVFIVMEWYKWGERKRERERERERKDLKFFPKTLVDLQNFKFL